MENKKENRGYNRDNKSDRGARDEFKQEGSYRKFGSRDGREKQDPEDLIYGIRAVIEAIKNEVELNRILIQKGMDKELFTELKDTLKGKDFQLQFVPIEKLNKITASNHQGVIGCRNFIQFFNRHKLQLKIFSF